jgi:UDPglucose--hexose-1-phosphate uridylyltransferase
MSKITRKSGLGALLSETAEFPSEIRTDYRDGHLSVISHMRGGSYLTHIMSDEYKISSGASVPVQPSAEEIARCAFEPGKESLNVDVLRLGKPWRIRVIENKSPSLVRSAPRSSRESEDGLFSLLGGYGAHEVVIESNNHQDVFEEMPQQRIREILGVLAEREEDLYAIPGVKYVQIFRNYGSRAGASMPHPHSQILAWPMLPTTIKKESQRVRAYRERRLRCLYKDALAGEHYGGRVLTENDTFVAIAPFGSRFAAESMILPKRHVNYFPSLSEKELGDLASILKTVLTTNRALFGNQPYNLTLHDLRQNPDMHMHFEIYPRILNVAGVELGQDVFVNTIPPEEYASKFRNKLSKKL